MATVTSLTAARMLAIEQSSVVGGLVDSRGRLLLSTKGGEEIDAGSVQGVGPAGTISMFAGDMAPEGHLLCDGAPVSRSTYATLFAVIGTIYGSGNGSTTFNLPNLKGRVPVGKDADQSEFNGLGLKGGAKTHQLTASEMPKHTHTQNSHNHTQNSHNHTQSSHNHTQNEHNHTQNSHNHTQASHNHTQDSHNHTTGSHNHTQASHNHTIDTPRWLSADNNTGGTMYAESSNTEKRVLNRKVDTTSGPTIYSTTVTVNSRTAKNQTTVATNNSQTATNKVALATNKTSTASNNSSTASNNATTATNQETGGDAAHNNLQPYVVLNYIIKT